MIKYWIVLVLLPTDTVSSILFNKAQFRGPRTWARLSWIMQRNSDNGITHRSLIGRIAGWSSCRRLSRNMRLITPINTFLRFSGTTFHLGRLKEETIFICVVIVWKNAMRSMKRWQCCLFWSVFLGFHIYRCALPRFLCVFLTYRWIIGRLLGEAGQATLRPWVSLPHRQSAMMEKAPWTGMCGSGISNLVKHQTKNGIPKMAVKRKA